VVGRVDLVEGLKGSNACQAAGRSHYSVTSSM
jgi:hypothetical protein